MLHLLGPSPAWRAADQAHALPNTLPGWTIAFLAAEGDWVARERLLALLWPEAASAEAQHNLRVNLHRVRTMLADWRLEDALESERRRVRLSLPNDVAALRLALAEPPQAAPQFPGALLPSMTFAGFTALREWADLERRSLAEAWREAALAWADRADATPAEVQAACQQMLQADALDEQALLRLLQSLHAQARFADVDRHYVAYRERLAKELGAEPAPALRAFAASTGTAAAPPADGAADAQAFVGRRLELAELARRFDQGARLVTLVGTGGIGKSSLARQALGRLAWPATWTDLQDLDRIEAVAARIAQRLEIDLRDDGDAAAQIARGLGDAPRVIALDNAEHLVDTLAPFAQRLLDAAPALRLLVTSRQPLGMVGESLLPLEGLAVPDADSRDAEAASSFDAVRLFELRARAARRGFELAPHAAAVIEIVERLGGLPLAIELAASWVRLLPPAEMAKELRESHQLLQSDPQGGHEPGRPEHVSMQRVLERSWQLLAERERQALTALCVFHGGFTAQAARDVADVTLPALSHLVGSALLRADEALGRFTMHPLVAEHARSFAEARQWSALQARHAEFMARLLGRWKQRRPDSPKAFVAEMDAEFANAEAACHHAIAKQHGEWIEAMLPAWRAYFNITGRYAQGIAMLEPAAALPLAPALRGWILSDMAGLHTRSYRPEAGRRLLGEALELAQAAGDHALAHRCIVNLGGAAMALQDFEQAHHWFARAVESAGRQNPALLHQGVARNNLGMVCVYLGRLDEALDHHAAAIDLLSAQGPTESMARALRNLAYVHLVESRRAEAREAMAAAWRYAADHGFAQVALDSEFLLGVCLVELGELDAAERHLQHAREGLERVQYAHYLVKVEIYEARIAGLRGDLQGAATRLLQALRLTRAQDYVEDTMYGLAFLADLLGHGGHVDEARRLLLGAQQVREARAEDVARLLRSRLTALPPAAVAATAPRLEDLHACIDDCHSLDEFAARLRRLRP